MFTHEYVHFAIIFMGGLVLVARSVAYVVSASEDPYPSYKAVSGLIFAGKELQNQPSNMRYLQFVSLKDFKNSLESQRKLKSSFGKELKETETPRQLRGTEHEDKLQYFKNKNYFNGQYETYSSSNNVINKHNDNADTLSDKSDISLKSNFEKFKPRSLQNTLGYQSLSLKKYLYVSTDDNLNRNVSEAAPIVEAIDLPYDQSELQIQSISKEISRNKNLVSKAGSEKERQATEDIKISQIFDGIHDVNVERSAYLNRLEKNPVENAPLRQKMAVELRGINSDEGTTTVSGFENKLKVSSQSNSTGILNYFDKFLSNRLRNYLRQGLKQLFPSTSLTTSDIKVPMQRNFKLNDMKSLGKIIKRRSLRSLQDDGVDMSVHTHPLNLESYGRAINTEDTSGKEVFLFKQTTANTVNITRPLFTHLNDAKNVTDNDDFPITNNQYDKNSWISEAHNFSEGTKDSIATFQMEAAELPTARTTGTDYSNHNNSNIIFVDDPVKALNIKPHFHSRSRLPIPMHEIRTIESPQIMKHRYIIPNKNVREPRIQESASFQWNKYSKPIFQPSFQSPFQQNYKPWYATRPQPNLKQSNYFKIYNYYNPKIYPKNTSESNLHEEIWREKEIDYDYGSDIGNHGYPYPTWPKQSYPWVTSQPYWRPIKPHGVWSTPVVNNETQFQPMNHWNYSSQYFPNPWNMMGTAGD